VTVEAYPNRTFRGMVTKVEPQAVVDQNVTMFPVLVELDNPEKLLRPGMNAEISIQIADRRDVVAVPNGAVVAPREAATVASVLGLRGEAVREQLRGTRGGGRGDGEGGGRRGSRGEREGREGRESRAEGAANRTGSEERGPRAAGAPSGPAAAPTPNAASTPGGSSGAGVAVPDGSRPGVVFVKGPSGPEAKSIRIGLSDLDYTEVISGIEPGAEVYLISVARLARQQESQDNRMRERMGGGVMGGMGGGGQRGGGGRGSGGGGRP
jgi:HlyD family secretion protein